MKGWFITGTDTGVGKTFVTALLLRALAARGNRVVGIKPVASGCRATRQGLRSEDAETLAAAGNVAARYDELNPYAFEPATAPHLAARSAGVRLDAAAIAARCRSFETRCDFALVEGVGGWLVPLNETESMADVARMLGFPVVVVVGLRLGCINHALLTCRAVGEAGLPMAGWIANGIDPEEAEADRVIEAIKTRVEAPLLARVPNRPSESFALPEGLEP
jgi:dethiobiotin synthetase